MIAKLLFKILLLFRKFNRKLELIWGGFRKILLSQKMGKRSKIVFSIFKYWSNNRRLNISFIFTNTTVSFYAYKFGELYLSFLQILGGEEVDLFDG